jgi:hypothetical protein
MDMRSRVLSVLNGKQPDVVPWLGDLDYWMQYLNVAGLMPDPYKGDGIYQLHRDLGLGFYLQGYFPYRTVYDGVQVIEEPMGRDKLIRVCTPYGELHEFQKWIDVSYCVAWSERMVKTWRDLPALRYLYEHTFYEPDYELAARRYDLIGDNGVVLCYLPKSPFMQMVALDAGIRAVTYALADAPEEFEATLAVMEQKAAEASEIALNSPAECLMIPENLSSEVVGKRFYNKYVRPHDTHWVERIRAAGKYSFIHIDGTLRGLIREASDTGFNVLEACTPAPVGDIAIEEINQWVAPGTVVWGGLPGIYFTDLISDEEFDAFVIRVLEVMKSAPRYVLGVADQVPPLARFERIARVRPLVEQYGRYA